MTISPSNMCSMVLASVTTFVGDHILPNVDIVIKIAVPILVGLVNHIVDHYFRRKEMKLKKQAETETAKNES